MRTEAGHDGQHGGELARGCATTLQLRPGMSFQEWSMLGCRLAHMSSALAWALGDWLLFGQRNFAGRYRVAVQETNLEYQTLRNYAWVAGRFSPSRRRDALSFQHHAEVAAMTEAEQELWLRRAESERLSRNQLRRQVRMHRLSLHQRTSPLVIMRFEVPPEDERRWRRAAASRHLPLQDWLRAVADDAARHVLAEVRHAQPGHLEPVQDRPAARHM